MSSQGLSNHRQFVRWFNRAFEQQETENIIAPHYWSLCRNPWAIRGFLPKKPALWMVFWFHDVIMKMIIFLRAVEVSNFDKTFLSTTTICPPLVRRMYHSYYNTHPVCVKQNMKWRRALSLSLSEGETAIKKEANGLPTSLDHCLLDNCNMIAVSRNMCHVRI